MATLGGNLRNPPNDTSTTSRWRRNRSSVNLLDQVASATPATSGPSSSKPEPKIERATSKMSLFNLFSRPKVEKARGHTEVGLAVPMPPPQPPPKPAPTSTPKSSLRLNPPSAAQQPHRSRSSQMLRPMSFRTPSVRQESSSWDPPPLFQAYPQSIKHATVQACVFSPDALLRTQSHRLQYDLIRERMDSHGDLSATLEHGANKKLEKSHKRLISNSVMSPSAPQLTNKVYVLDTLGHVLQYSGEGSFDRLPEKVLQLGKESAAFACDLIPGKHFVLQISQSAKEDGTVALAPKSSLLSRFRSQPSSLKRSATSFLLVLDSADEMKAWMTAVRKEIENMGGMKVAEDTTRESSSMEVSSGKNSQESAVPSHRYQVRRDPNRMSKISPVDSPLQSQYSGSPKVVGAEWEGDGSEKTFSVSDTASVQSSGKRSIEVPSITRTSGSNPEHLRDRSRLSYVSTNTSVSGPPTRHTSRDSSPAQSPLREGFSLTDTEPIRSAMSLRSFHMNPSNSATYRRRSMQPLPTTNEDTSLSADSPVISPQRHSFYGPISPTTSKTDQKTVVPAITSGSNPAPTSASAPSPAPSSNSQLAPLLWPVRYGTRSSSAPPARHGVISPPPRDPAPPPGRRPLSTVDNLNTTSAAAHRMSQGPKPFVRPFPVRPQQQHADGNLVLPRRVSSFGPPPIALGIAVNRSVTAPVRPSATTTSPTGSSDPRRTSSSSQPLRRPTSVQIRSDPAPFLSSSRTNNGPVRAISSTPSFVPSKRASTIAPNSQSQQRLSVVPRRSMPAMGLPPPAPPPNMPLPPPPPMANASAVVV
ncbi:uncharacterized protein EI97DRAFT_448180 [Westerdykella ornata]|uniref:PH domain-containing protein n=1 Tax=Westerdykella ornata TaxID=318751 RepID=A0A6A6JS23_WESOR|nr:uncharacterized protein EI97DRAFT_448180 [Westerdykella ornata]KAF2279400.1 hypothetical protein EI97DRAFT_448180 [Westerdykella ornata]